MESTLLRALLSTQTPLLPDVNLVRWAGTVSWVCVLLFLALVLGQRWPRPVRWGLAALLVAWALMPGASSPSFWLGLAFQMPSLSTTLLSLGGALLLVKTGNWRLPESGRMQALRRLGLAGIVLGWLLLLDTFALWPVSLYAYGFSPVLVLIVALLAGLPWMLFGARHPATIVTRLLGLVILLYVLLHLPNGNLWNALIDPWLWIALQVGALRRGAQRFRAWRHG